MTKRELSENVGNTIRWEETVCSHRGTYRILEGVLKESHGWNVLINDDWLFWKDFVNPEILKATPRLG